MSITKSKIAPDYVSAEGIAEPLPAKTGLA
jgi:hypothetical protein